MSAIASFTRIPISALPAIRDAVIPKKKLFGGVNDTFHEALKKNGSVATTYEWSGYVLATLLPFLEEQGVNLMKAEQDELSTYVSQSRRATCFILTSGLKRHLDRLSPGAFSEDSLRDYYNEFNASDESEVGKPMLDGIRALRESLQVVDNDSVVLLYIG